MGPLTVGDSVYRNEVVRTGADSTAKLIFLDSTNLGVGPVSRVTLDQFVYVGESNGQKMAVNLAKGVFRFTTGKLDKSAYIISTPSAAIGVRGHGARHQRAERAIARDAGRGPGARLSAPAGDHLRAADPQLRPRRGRPGGPRCECVDLTNVGQTAQVKKAGGANQASLTSTPVNFAVALRRRFLALLGQQLRVRGPNRRLRLRRAVRTIGSARLPERRSRHASPSDDARHSASASDLTRRYCGLGMLGRCPFALPFVRAASGDASDVRHAGLGAGRGRDLSVHARRLLAPSAWRRRHVVARGDGRMDHRPWRRAARRPVQPIRCRARRGPRMNGCRKLMLALAFRVGGWSGVVLLTGAAAATAALIVGLIAARELRGAPLVATVAIGLSLVTANLLARPHVLALPLAAAWSAGLIGARDRGRAPPLGLAALMTAWANMHGGFIFGLMLIGPFALEAVTEAPVGARLSAARGWATFALAALAARAHQSVRGRRAPPAVPPDVGREPVAHRRMAAAGLQPYRNDGAGAADAARTHADPAVRHAADPRGAHPRAHCDGAAAFAPSGVAGDPRADAAGAADRGGDRRRAFRRRVAARRADRVRRDPRGGAGDRRRAARSADRTDRRRRRADLGLERGPGGPQAEAGAQRLCVWRLSHLRACAAVHRRPGGALRRHDAEPLRPAPERRPRRRSTTRSSATASPGRSSLPTAGSSPRSTASPAGGASIPTPRRSSTCGTGRRGRRAPWGEGTEGLCGREWFPGRCHCENPNLWGAADALFFRNERFQRVCAIFPTDPPPHWRRQRGRPRALPKTRHSTTAQAR